MLAAQARDMALYNRWMNERLYEVCSELSDLERKENRGAYFQSIHGTLNHILVGDKIWLGRFLNEPFTVSSLNQELHGNFEDLRRDRAGTDEIIIQWANTLTDSALQGQLEYTSIVNPAPRRYEMWLAVAHFFNHQTHHRGQLTTLLSQAGKDYGVTDLIWLPEVVERNAM